MTCPQAEGQVRLLDDTVFSTSYIDLAKVAGSSGMGVRLGSAPRSQRNLDSASLTSLHACQPGVWCDRFPRRLTLSTCSMLTFNHGGVFGCRRISSVVIHRMSATSAASEIVGSPDS